MKNTRFRFERPNRAPPGLTEAIRNPKRTNARQQVELMAAAYRLQRAGQPVEVKALLDAAPSLRLCDVTPVRLREAANVIRREATFDLQAYRATAAALDALAGAPATPQQAAEIAAQAVAPKETAA